MIKKLILGLIVLPLNLFGMQKVVTDAEKGTWKSSLNPEDMVHNYTLEKNADGSYNLYFFASSTQSSVETGDTATSYGQFSTNSDTHFCYKIKPYANENSSDSTSAKNHPRITFNTETSHQNYTPTQQPLTQEQEEVFTLAQTSNNAIQTAAQGTEVGHKDSHAKVCQGYNTFSESLKKQVERTDSKHKLQDIINLAQEKKAELRQTFEWMEKRRQQDGIQDRDIWQSSFDYPSEHEKFEENTLQSLNDAIKIAEEKINDLALDKAREKFEKFEALSSPEKVKKLQKLNKKHAQEKDPFKQTVLEHRINHANDFFTKENIKKQKNKSIQESREKSQQKTYTPAYQEKLQSIKKELESKGLLTPTEAKRLRAINQTLANNGAVSELETIDNPEEVFVGNDFQKQIYQESLNALTQAAGLNANAAENQQILACTRKAEDYSSWAMSMLKDDQNPALATAAAETAAGFIKQAQAIAIADQKTPTAVTNQKIQESDIALLGETLADGTYEFSKNFAVGAFEEVKDISTVINNTLTHPEQTAQKVVDNVQEAFKNYKEQKQKIWNECSGDGKTMRDLLKDAHPDALPLFQSQMQQYQEMGYSAHAAEAFVISDILSAQKTELAWKNLSNTVKNATPGELGNLAGRMVAGTLLLDGGMQVLGGQLALVKAGGESALHKADSALKTLAEETKNATQSASDLANGVKQVFDDNKYYRVAGIDVPVSGKALNEMETLNQQALLRDLKNSGTERYRLPKTMTMNEFLTTQFGKSIQPHLERTGKVWNTKPIFKLTENISENLRRGDLIYIDAGHSTEIEVFNK
ncbi:hypothetical protein CVU75_02835, partial [Candidatus Dependentiae bacterium HGW-Dependentiae-1]